MIDLSPRLAAASRQPKLKKRDGLAEHTRSASEANGKKEDLAANSTSVDPVNSEIGKRFFVFPDWAGWMTVRCGPYRCRRAKRMSPSQKISKKAPAARLIVCPYQARAHPLVSAHEGFGSLTIEKNIVLAAAAVDRLLARPQCVELIKLVRMRTGGSELSGGLRRLLEVGMCLARRAAFSW
jgi:hypothetical protein